MIQTTSKHHTKANMSLESRLKTIACNLEYGGDANKRTPAINCMFVPEDF